MSYRGVQSDRIARQHGDLMVGAGQTAVWRQFVSASAGVAVAGRGSTFYYRQQTITGFFGNRGPEQFFRERQTPGGLIAAGDLYAVTRETLGRRDELIYRGALYRVDSDPMPAQIASHFVTLFKRGGSGV